MRERRGKFEEGRYAGQAVNPTMDLAIARADGATVAHGLRLRPMKIERLIAAGGRLTETEQARVRYHQVGDVAAVAREMGKPESWVREVCAWDIEQRRQSKVE